MSSRTIFLSRLLGLYCILVPLSLLLNEQGSLATFNSLAQDPPVLLILGVITCAIGLAIVLGHNVWSGGGVPVAVTLVGWITLIKGLTFLLLPPEAMANLFAALHYEQRYYLYFTVPVAIGVYLTYGGFKSALSRAPRRINARRAA